MRNTKKLILASIEPKEYVQTLALKKGRVSFVSRYG
jgi:hypothetical protein